MPWLRWWNGQGTLLPTPQDAVEAERQRAKAAEVVSRQQHQVIEQLRACLRALGQPVDDKH